MRDFKVRSSHFSLGFSVIGPSNYCETRSKVDSHCKSYTWVSEVRSFNKGDRGFLLLGYLLFKKTI